MPNPYDIISPASISNLNNVVDNPQDTEAANLLGKYELQIKYWLVDFCTLIIDDSNTQPTIKAAALTALSLAGLVNGSTANNSGTQRGVVQGTVSTPDLRDLAVQTVKLDDTAVTTAKLADSAITTAKLLDLAVTAAKIANATITATQLADNAVTTAKITDANVTTAKITDTNVTTAKIANSAVTFAKLQNGGAAGQIPIAGTTPFTFASTAISGDATLASDGTLTLVNKGIVEVEERAAANTSAGTATAGGGAAGWQTRGTSIAWTKTFDTLSSSFLTITSEKLTLAAGTYEIAASAPAYKVDGHLIKLVRYNSSNVVQESIYGSSEIAAAADACTTRSHALAKMTFAAGDYLTVRHWVGTTEATDGLGKAINASSEGGITVYEIYAQVRIQRIA